jgi:hypothetical protein
MDNSRQNSSRNFRERVDMDAVTYNELVWGVLDRAYAPFKHAEKKLARDARATPKAARNWLDRLCAPNGESLLNLMRECNELRDEIIRRTEQREREGNDHGEPGN